MHILMFGHLTILDGGRRLGAGDLGGIKPKEILELLLLARGHFVSTDVLAEELWPARTPKDAAAAINTYVSVLRHRMFSDRADAKQVLVTAPRAYRLAVEALTIDRDRFDDLVVEAERAPRQTRLRILSEAVALVRGDLLGDAPYNSWVQDDRQLYRDRATRAHLALSRDWLLESQATTALRCAEAALRLSRYSEEAFRLAMLANYALGHDDIARQTYRRCCNFLANELGVDVTTETAELAASIDAGVPAAILISPAAAPFDTAIAV